MPGITFDIQMRDFIARQNSERLRQRLSAGMRVREPAAFTKIARSLIDMALVTAIVARLYRVMVLTRPESSGAFLAAMLTAGAIFLISMATIHLSRFPLRDWLWRAPAFAALEGAFEMLVSLGLIALHREPLGTGAADFSNWPGMAVGTIAWRILVISVFALLLAMVVKWVRYILLRRRHEAWSAGTVRSLIPGEGFTDRRRHQ